MIRVLVYMNPLVVDKISKKFLWEKDSGFLYAKQQINKLPNDWRFTILVPKGFDRNFFDDKHIIDCVEYDYSTSIHQNRYHFNRNILADTFPYGTDIDLVINHQPEVTANIKTFFQNQRREKPLIINYFHWIDCKESRQYGNRLGGFVWRQVEGINEADLSLFHTWYAIELMDQSRQENKLEYRNEPTLGYFTPEPTKFGDVPFELPDKKIILFNHRLNNTTGWKEVVDICEKIHEKRDDFILWITDDQNLREKKLLEEKKWIKIQRIPFENYGYLIKNSHFAICNTQGYATWNMAVLDCLMNGCVPIAPHNRLYSSMLGKDFIMHGEMSKHGGLSDMVEGMLDTPKNLLDEWLTVPETSKDLNITEFVESRIFDKIKDKTIKKYDDVTKYIIENSPCEKRDFVNKFWSFHANSNFQLIRWKLLYDGFIDDTRQKLTIYSKK